ncbi:MAG: RecQ family ATP-dependent DNA helicase [Verrucomicrobiota bacterium]|nr:RecQ family ATP-dependent DNA helicase [Verrucomicrobiota bacterium]
MSTNDPARRDIHETLESVFGFGEFREGQEKVIRQILAGHSALAVFPTGSGKSLCYQLSALHLDGLTLVVSPLIALMKDQIDFLRERHVEAARLDSSVAPDEFRRIDAELRARTLKLLYVAPERFSNERFIHKLRRLPIALMVIDEAHCISEWGHNFRPDYLKLARLARSLAVPRVLTLTATATPAVAADICREFEIAPEAFIHTGFHRPNLVLRASGCASGKQTPLLLSRLGERPRGPTIVYVTLQRTAETVATALAGNGFPARPYHAGLETEERNQVQDWFMDSADPIVVATIAFGMGIDKSDIRYVYHYNLPKSLENYSQEIGRSGRDGRESTCEMLACGDDVTILENFTYGDTPDAASVGAIVDAVLAHDGQFDVSMHQLSRAHDVRPLVVSTLLTYLELADVIEATAPFYSEYQFQPLSSSKEILARFEGERADFLRRVFASATKAQKWFHIDVDETARRLGTPRDRLVKAFTYLEEQGDLILKVAGVRQGYRIKLRPSDTAALKRTLVERFETRERSDIARVRQVVELVERPGCIVRRLLSYFGEDLGRDCGHCGPCLGETPPAVSPTRGKAPVLERPAIDALRREHPKALSSVRQISRFLCGLASPLLTQTKLTRQPLFGSQAKAPFHEVLSAAGSLWGGEALNRESLNR